VVAVQRAQPHEQFSGIDLLKHRLQIATLGRYQVAMRSDLFQQLFGQIAHRLVHLGLQFFFKVRPDIEDAFR